MQINKQKTFYIEVKRSRNPHIIKLVFVTDNSSVKRKD